MFQKKLENLNCFLVGAGAIGCEYLKQFAMMGIGCGKSGRITLTDMDTIEKSNLNRQFLFRNSDIQKSKSTVAAREVKKINSKINIVSQINRVGKESETLYNDEFFQSIDGVCNALDNLESRNYIDKKCLFYKKPLIESGTSGLECQVQVILPYLTKSYSSTQGEINEKTIPVCTIKLFPTAVHHTLQWAKELFNEYFNLQPKLILEYLDNPWEFINAKLNDDNKNDVYNSLVKYKISSFEDCLIWAINKWKLNFNRLIKNILKDFPENSMSEEGIPIWSGIKKCPKVLEFDSTNLEHLNFIKSSATLLAKVYSINELITEDEKIIELIDKFKKINDVDQDIDLDELKNELNLIKNLKYNLRPLEFDKDIDLHMDFIVNCSNLRAENYNILKADKYKSKLIAGRIIPAIATTTSLVVGLNCIELYKVIYLFNYNLKKFIFNQLSFF